MMQKLHYKETKKLPVILEREEIVKIIETIKKSESYFKNDWGLWMKVRDITMIMMGLMMGLRPREICWAKFEDFDLRNMTFKVRAENNKQRKERIVPVPSSFIPYLKAYLSFPRARFWKGSSYLFPSFQNEKISSKRLETRFRKILKEANLYRRGKSPYSLRHTCLSELYNQTKDLFLVANVAGHARLYDTYLHTDRDYREYEREQLEKLFKKTL